MIDKFLTTIMEKLAMRAPAVVRSRTMSPRFEQTVTRVYPSAITDLNRWATFDIALIQDDPENTGNTSSVDHASVNGSPAHFQVSWPGTNETLVGDQVILLRVRASFSGGNVRVLIYEGTTLRADLGAKSVSTSVGVLRWTFDGNAIGNASALQVRVRLEDNFSGGYYSIYGLAWDRHTGVRGGTGAPVEWEHVTAAKAKLTSSSSTLTVSNVQFPAGKLFFCITNRMTGSTITVNSITHNAVSNAARIGQPHTVVVANNHSTAEEWIADSSGGTGNLTIQFSGTTYFASLFVLRLSSNATVEATNGTTGSGANINISATDPDATHGLAVAIGHMGTQNATLSGAPWNDVADSSDMNSAWDKTAIVAERGSVSGQTVTFTPSAGTLAGAAAVVVLVKDTSGASGGGDGGDGGDGGGGGGTMPSAWGAVPPLGSWHGIGQPFGFSYNSQGQLTWQPLRDYNAWLGRPANICKVFPRMDMDGVGTWDGVAGGSGSADTTWGGQLSEVNPTRAFDPTYWPVANPIVLALCGVPLSHSNSYTSSGWKRPGIWQEIAAGNYDLYYTRLFRRIAYRCGQTGRDPKTVVIRWNAEANGTWHPYSIGPDVANWIVAWRRVMDLMRNAVGAVLGAGKTFLIEFGPSGHLRFGNRTTVRLWDIYPGDDWADICGLGIHDQVGIKTQADWDQYLRYPTKLREFEGHLDWLDFARSRNKLVGTSEIESNYYSRQHFPKTENMSVMWTTGFEPVRRRYAGAFAYFIYLWNGHSALNRSDGWGEPYRQLYKP